MPRSCSLPTLLAWMLVLTAGAREAVAAPHESDHGAQTSTVPSGAPDLPLEEVKVTLLGQPCLMQGPIPQEALRQVHSASPDQIYPVEPTDLQVKRALERIRAVHKLPAFLDRYRERLTLRLEAQHAFFDALERARRSAKPTPLTAAAKRYFQAGHGTRRFDSLARKFVAALGSRKSGGRAAHSTATDTQAQVSELWTEYGLHIEPDPEEEFHRAVQKAGIRYDCSFEGGDEDDEADETPPSPLPSASPASGAAAVPRDVHGDTHGATHGHAH